MLSESIPLENDILHRCSNTGDRTVATDRRILTGTSSYPLEESRKLLIVENDSSKEIGGRVDWLKPMV